MKPALSVLTICCLATISSLANNSSFVGIDTTIITHSLDGHIPEWPAEKFIIDKATKMRYAADNDDQLLYIAISVIDKRQQQSIMQQGMKLFIDTKGKKKENRGIQFPLGMENGLLNVDKMKVFGFGNGESLPLNIKSEGTINIAIAWDTSFNMSIEYHIPLNLLEKTPADLNNKNISIGWKIEDSDMPVSNSQGVSSSSGASAVTTRLVGVPAGSRPPSGNRSVPSVNSNPPTQPTSTRSQSMWTSHTISF